MIPKRKEQKWEYLVHFEYEYNRGFNDCHSKFTKAMVERLEKGIDDCFDADDDVYRMLLDNIDQLIKELKDV